MFKVKGGGVVLLSTIRTDKAYDIGVNVILYEILHQQNYRGSCFKEVRVTWKHWPVEALRRFQYTKLWRNSFKRTRI